MRRGNFEGEKGQPIVKYRDSAHCAMSYAKTAEQIEMFVYTVSIIYCGLFSS